MAKPTKSLEARLPVLVRTAMGLMDDEGAAQTLDSSTRSVTRWRKDDHEFVARVVDACRPLVEKAIDAASAAIVADDDPDIAVADFDELARLRSEVERLRRVAGKQAAEILELREGRAPDPEQRILERIDKVISLVEGLAKAVAKLKR